MIWYIVAGIAGYLIGESSREEEKPKKSDTKLHKYWVSFSVDDEKYGHDNFMLDFDSYEDAKKWFEKLSKNKYIKAKDIHENSIMEIKLRKSIKEADSNAEFPPDNYKFDITGIIWGMDDVEFEEIEKL